MRFSRMTTCGAIAALLEDMWATAALCIWVGVHVFMWKWWSFLAFQIYHIVYKILLKIVSDMEWDIKDWSVSWIPSFSWGRLSILIDGEKENHTTRGRSQWKNKWASFSTAPQVLQCSSMWVGIPCRSVYSCQCTSDEPPSEGFDYWWEIFAFPSSPKNLMGLGKDAPRTVLWTLNDVCYWKMLIDFLGGIKRGYVSRDQGNK
jgi:hypothetical protein